MLKAIMAVDEDGGVSKSGSMPWGKNSADLKWFKQNTLNHVVIMGRLTWIDPYIPPPLSSRINVIITNQSHDLFPKADICIKGDLSEGIKKIVNQYSKLEK